MRRTSPYSPDAIDGAEFVASQLSERDFQGQVTALARGFGWTYYHTYNSRRSTKGFPDLVLVRPPRIVYAELKRQNGRVSREQEMWLCLLRECGQDAYLWRPSDWNAITEVLE